MIEKTKKIKYIFSILFIFMSVLTACQPTPEEIVVKSKVDDNYIDKINESEKLDIKIEDSIEPAYITGTDKWEEIITTKSKGLNIEIKADLIVPQVSSFSAIEVMPSKMTQEQIDNFLHRFFPMREAFTSQDIAQIPTKSEIEAKILMLKEWIATSEVNSDENGITNHKRWQDEINFYTEQLADAPDEHPEMFYDITKFSLIPLMEIDWEEGMTIEELDKRLNEMKEREKKRNSELISYDIHIDDNIYKIYALRSNEPYVNRFWLSCNKIANIISGIESHQNIPRLNTTYKQAKNIADEAASILGFHYMSMVYSSIDMVATIVHNNAIEDNMYHFVYTRLVEGVNIIYTNNRIDRIKLTYKPWAYENFEIWINDNGIQKVEHSSCPSIIGKVISKNIPLLPLYEIQEKARQSFNLGILEHSLNSYDVEKLLQQNMAIVNENNIIIDKVILGYMRIKQGNGDNSYIIIPVWDFIGRENIRMEVKDKNSEETYEIMTEMPEMGYGDQHSFLTINAIDGSIIDRELGY